VTVIFLFFVEDDSNEVVTNGSDSYFFAFSKVSERKHDNGYLNDLHETV